MEIAEFDSGKAVPLLAGIIMHRDVTISESHNTIISQVHGSIFIMILNIKDKTWRKCIGRLLNIDFKKSAEGVCSSSGPAASSCVRHLFSFLGTGNQNASTRRI